MGVVNVSTLAAKPRALQQQSSSMVEFPAKLNPFALQGTARLFQVVETLLLLLST